RSAHAHRDARADVVPKSDRAYKLGAGDCKQLSCGKARGDNGNSGMRAGWTMRVVGLIGMREDTVGECGLDGAAYNVGSHNGGNLLAPIAASKLDGGAPGRQARAGN